MKTLGKKYLMKAHMGTGFNAYPSTKELALMDLTWKIWREMTNYKPSPMMSPHKQPVLKELIEGA
jgi:hypothetical protein